MHEGTQISQIHPAAQIAQIDARVPARNRDPLTYDVIGAAMEAHGKLGPGLPEKVYQEAFARELRKRGIPFELEVEMEILYDGEPLRHHFRADVVVAGILVVELKALQAMGFIECAQILTYLRVGRLKKGLLLNFGAASLECQRFIA